MPEPDLVELFALPLHRAGVRYLVAGSVGAMVYSEPRLTRDIDLAVALDEAALAALPALFPEPDFTVRRPRCCKRKTAANAAHISTCYTRRRD